MVGIPGVVRSWRALSRTLPNSGGPNSRALGGPIDVSLSGTRLEFPSLGLFFFFLFVPRMGACPWEVQRGGGRRRSPKGREKALLTEHGPQ